MDDNSNNISCRDKGIRRNNIAFPDILTLSILLSTYNNPLTIGPENEDVVTDPY